MISNEDCVEKLEEFRNVLIKFTNKRKHTKLDKQAIINQYDFMVDVLFDVD